MAADRAAVYFQPVRRAMTAWAVALVLTATGAGRAAAGGGGAAALGAAYRAFSEGDYRRALSLARKIDRAAVKNRDYVAYLAAQSAYLVGDLDGALRELEALATAKDSRFRGWAAWRVA